MIFRQIVIGFYAILFLGLLFAYGFWYTFLAMFIGTMIPMAVMYLAVPTLNIIWGLLTLITWITMLAVVPDMSFDGHEDFIMWCVIFIPAVPLSIYDLIASFFD